MWPKGCLQIFFFRRTHSSNAVAIVLEETCYMLYVKGQTVFKKKANTELYMQPWQWWKFLIPHFIDLAFSLSLFGILTLKIHVKLCTKVIGAILKTQKVFSLFLTLSIPHILSSRWFHRGKGLLFLKIKKKLFVKIVFFPMIQGNSF